MGLKPEISLGVGLATAAVVWGVYQNATPTIADLRAGPQGDEIAEGTRKMAAWTAAGVVGAISLLAKDATVFILGGAMVVAVDWWHRHAIQFNPDTGRATTMPAVGLSQTLVVEDPSAGGVA